MSSFFMRLALPLIRGLSAMGDIVGDVFMAAVTGVGKCRADVQQQDSDQNNFFHCEPLIIICLDESLMKHILCHEFRKVLLIQIK